MWREFLSKLSKSCVFHRPATDDAIEATEKQLLLKLPKELLELFSETNGVEGEYELGLIWPIERVRDENISFRANRDFRDLYMPFESLLFFADAGNGDQFAYPICGGDISRTDIFVWNHENDSRSWVAPSLQLYLDWWLTGRIKI